MLRRLFIAAMLATSLGVVADTASADQRAYGQTWGGQSDFRDWNRFYHYPYVYYPQNFYGQEYYKSSDSLYYRYPPEMRIPVYNKQWHNYYPEAANWDRYITGRYKGPPTGGRYHMGHHFILDTF